MFDAYIQFIRNTQHSRRFFAAVARPRWGLALLLAISAIATAPLSARAQAPLFSQAQFDKCVEILGIQVFALIESDPTKIREAAEARSAEMQAVLQNIQGDLLLGQGLGSLSRYESTYLHAAYAKGREIEEQLSSLTREIECWRHLEKLYELAKLNRPPARPNAPEPRPADPGGLDKIMKDRVLGEIKALFDKRADDVRKLRNRVKKNRKTILDEINRRKLADAAQPVPPKPPGPPDSAIQQPPIDTRQAQTGVTIADGGTLMLGGLLRGPPMLYVGLDASLGLGDNQTSVTPGGQSIDLDGKVGWGVRAGIVAPIAGRFAAAFGAKFLHSKDDTVRLNNADGTFVNTGGSNEINAIVGEFSGLLTAPNGVTFRASGYLGGAERKINLISGGATALDFSDWVSASGFGFGVGVPVTILGIDVPGLCVNAGMDFMHYGGADGSTPAGAPISLGSIDDTRATVGMTFHTNIWQAVPGGH
jgi:hypothetical protein